MGDGDRRLRSSALHLAFVFAVSFGVFAYTSPRTVAFEDDGGFVMAADLLGIAHPPGYPLFVLLAKPFTWIPLGEVAWRVHLASACFGALAVCVVWRIVRRLTASRGVAHASALALAFSETFWSQAIVAEVYTLNVLVFVSLVALSLDYVEDPRPARATALGLVFGLGLCNHWPLLLLVVPGLALMLWPQRSALLRASPRVFAALALGLLPYAWMWIRASQEPAVSYFGPFESPRELASFVARRLYASVEAGAAFDWGDKLQFAAFFGREWLRQYTWVGALIALVGLVASLRRHSRAWNLGLIAAFGGSSALLTLLLGVAYDFHWQSVARVYPLTGYAVTAIWLAEGLAWLERRTPAPRALGVGTGVGLLLAAALVVRSWGANDRHDFDLARDSAATLLEMLPENAILFTHSDFEAFPAGYLHLVEGLRPDVDLYNQTGAVFGKRLFKPRVSAREKARRLDEFVRESRRPVFFMDRGVLPYGGDDYGYFARLDATRPLGVREPVIDPALVALAHRFVAHQDDPEPWTRTFSQRFVSHHAQFLTLALHDPRTSSATRNRYEPELEALSQTHHGRFGRLRAAAALEDEADEQLLEWALELEATLEPDAPRSHRSAVYQLTGSLLERSGRRDEAAERYRRARDPH